MHYCKSSEDDIAIYTSKTKNDRNKWISDSESWHLGGYTWLTKGSNCTNNIHVQRDAQKHCFVYPRTTLNTAIVGKWYKVVNMLNGDVLIAHVDYVGYVVKT